jgi:DNA mismatch repair protein MutS2
MNIEPKDLLERLEFDKILQLLENECVGELGKQEVRQLFPATEASSIEGWLQETIEMKNALETNDRLPIATYDDIAPDLRMLEVIDYVLPVDGLQRINRVLRVFREVFRYFTPSRQAVYPALYRHVRQLQWDETLAKAIDAIIDEEGNIRPDASPALMRIHKAIQNRQRELDKVFRELIANYRTKGWLSDNVESIRNGRRVLSVPSEHKRKIRGIIHDESASGHTAFIEPEPIIEINNDIFDLETEERREIYRLLKELSALLHPYTGVLRQYLRVLVDFDFIQAKARLALRMSATAPVLRREPHFGIWQGYHPLLLLKNKQTGKRTVPFDLTLLHDNRILLVSGPNAGGKSIFMKAVGLLQLMVQSGIPVPVRGDSEMGIFKKIFADIGDQQSLEDDLSTYSSRLENMRRLLEHASKDSLVLIDEFGAGTDPKIGGAIAEAILRSLNERKVAGIINTHYSNLKIYAFKNKGIVNGAMHFDRENLTPTYELKVGRPGSSYAFEIAQKTGLPKDLLEYARHRAGKNERAVDELLIDLQREKKEVEDKLKEMTEREKKLDRLIKNYEEMQRDLEFRRKRLKLDAKEQALQDVARESKELERLVREIRESQNVEKAKALVQESRQKREELQGEVHELREKVYIEPTSSAKKKEIKVGDFVKLRSGGATGQVESIEKNKARVKVGEMRMTIPLLDLVAANEPLDTKSTLSVQADTVEKSSKFESKIDLRGLRMGDALKVLEDFVDSALLTSTNTLRIVHGKGDGVLRKAVKRKLQEYDAITSVYHPEHDAGGDGVTIAELE